MTEAHYLGALLHNLGVAANLDSSQPRVHRDPVDLAALVARVMGRHRPVARQRGVAIESAVPTSRCSPRAT